MHSYTLIRMRIHSYIYIYIYIYIYVRIYICIVTVPQSECMQRCSRLQCGQGFFLSATTLDHPSSQPLLTVKPPTIKQGRRRGGGLYVSYAGFK